MERKQDEEIERWMRRRRRRQEMRRRRRRRALIKRAVLAGGTVLVLVLALVLVLPAVMKRAKKEEGPKEGQMSGAVGESLIVRGPDGAQSPEETADADSRENGGEDADAPEDEEEENPSYRFADAEDMLHPGDELVSSHAIFVDLNEGTVVAGKEERSRMIPASMTKVLTLLVAAEHTENLDEPFAMPAEAVDYSFKYRCSCAGFEKEELVTVKDLMYGTVLPSGAEAAVGLAMCVAGSHEAFVELMNEKLEELGLSGTAHFTNCVGVYDDDHYCTAYDMAIIMKAALDDETCKEVLSARTYLTSATEQHPEGLLLSNWFLRRIEDKDTGGKVSAAKTGFVDESMFCAVSYGTDNGGKEYICVTASAPGNWPCINDHVWLYRRFAETGAD